jgi:hypothetical protein
MKARGGEQSREVVVPGAGLRLALSADLRTAPLRRGGY